MALIRKNEFRKMTEAQLKEKLTELKKELMKINTQRSSGTTPENPGKIKLIKKTIATILMVLHQKETKTYKEETRKI